MDKIKRFKMRAESKLMTDVCYNWHDGGEESKESDSLIEFKNDGSIKWKEEAEKGTWYLEEFDKVVAEFDGTKFTLKFDSEKLFWVV
jgi:hypothetical protein